MKKLLAVLCLCFVILVPLVLVVSAESTLVFHITIMDNPDGTSQGDYLKVKFTYSSNGQTFEAGPYSNGSSSVIQGDFFSLLTLQTSVQNTYNYSGAIVTVTSDGQDITAIILDMQPTNGYFYVPFDTPITLYQTFGGETLEFYFQAIDWDDYMDRQYGYQAGYDAGLTYGYNKCLDEMYYPLLRQYNLLQQSQGGATEQQLKDSYHDGFNAGVNAMASENGLVKDTIASTIDATGNVLFQLLNIQFFGIPISMIFAALLLIPATIFAIKLFMHKG